MASQRYGGFEAQRYERERAERLRRRPGPMLEIVTDDDGAQRYLASGVLVSDDGEPRVMGEPGDLSDEEEARVLARWRERYEAQR